MEGKAARGPVLGDAADCSRATRSPLASSLQARQDEARAKLRLYAVPEDAEKKLWAQLDDSYFLRHEPQEIAWHTRLLYYRVADAGTRGQGAPVTRRVKACRS